MRNLRPSVITILQSLYIFTTAIIGMLYANYHGFSAILNPVAGAAVGMYVLYQKKSIKGIIIGLFVAYFLYRQWEFDETILTTLVVSIFITAGILVYMILFDFLVRKIKLDVRKIIGFQHVVNYLVIAAIVGFLGSIIPLSGYYLVYGNEQLLNMYLAYAIGSFSGIVVFGSLTINSYYHDDSIDLWSKNGVFSVLYVLTFVMVSVLLFTSKSFVIPYESFMLLYVILYIISCFAFPFRMIITSNVLFLLLHSFLLYRQLDSNIQIIEGLKITLYLVVLSLVSVLVRMVVLNLNQRNNDLKKANGLLEKIIISTNDLCNVQDQLPQDQALFAKQYLADMFRIACDIYPKFDFATCFVQGENKVDFVGAQGYDLDHINALRFNPEAFNWSFHIPEIVVETNYQNVFPMEGNLDDFRSRYKKITEAIRFTIKLGDDWYGGMSFDILEGNSKHFDQIDLDNFTSFQNVVNSYFSVRTLNSQNNSLKDDIVLSLVRVLELYDSYTGSHSTDVADLAVEIAHKLQLSDEDIRHIYWASILHDIGKIGINSDILNTPGPLSEMDYEIVKQHPIFGYAILAQSDGLKEIAKTVRHHHEWWNGNGYPDGLRSIAIPYSSQIIHVCDAVAAMSSERVYKKRLSDQEIIVQLQEGFGKQFSPKVAKCMIQFIQDGEFDKFCFNHNLKGE